MVELVRKKPFGIVLLYGMLGFIGAGGTVAGIWILTGALFGDGPFTVNGEPASKGEFLGLILPFMAVYLPACVLALVGAILVHRQDPRSRHFFMAYFCIPLLFGLLMLQMGVSLTEVLGSAWLFFAFPLGAWWYLYRRASVVDYYQALSLDKEPFPPAG